MPAKLLAALNAIRASPVRRIQQLPPLEITEPVVDEQEEPEVDVHELRGQVSLLQRQTDLLQARNDMLERRIQLLEATNTCILTQNTAIATKVSELETLFETFLIKRNDSDTQTNKRFEQVEKRCGENANNLKEHQRSVDEQLKQIKTQTASSLPGDESKPLVPSPPAKPHRAAVSVRNIRPQVSQTHSPMTVETSVAALGKSFRSELVKILTCPLINKISADPVVSLDGYVGDRSALEAHYRCNVRSPFGYKAVEQVGWIDCPVLTTVCNMLIESEGMEDAAGLLDLYKRIRKLVPISIENHQLVYVTSKGYICEDLVVRWGTRGVCPVTGDEWDNRYSVCGAVRNMCKLICFNSRLADAVLE